MTVPFSGLSIFVTIAGKLLTPDDLGLLQIDVTDEDEGDNEVNLHCIDNNFSIADSSLFRVGQQMSIKFGYTNGEMSLERSGYVLMKPSTNYAKDGVLSKIKASTKSATLGVRRPQKSFGQTSLGAVVQDIAKRNGLKLELKGGKERLQSFAQGNWSDRQTLRTLADRFNYQVSYTSDTITFAPRDYGLVPTLELIYGNGEDSNIIHADLEVNAKQEDSDTHISSVDPATKELKTQTAGEADKALAISAEDGHSWAVSDQHHLSSSSRAGTAQVVARFSNPQVASSTPAPGVSSDPGDIKTLLSTPDTVDGNMQAHATSDKLKKQKKKGELTITTAGIPSAKARILVHVKGLAKRDSGNWYVTSVTHSISKHDGFTTKFELNRHGNNTKGGEKTIPPLNNQLPSSSVTKPVVAISAESGEITRKP